nr:soluble beta-fructofuranosidase isoenzyme I, S-beta F=invertase [Daucus carota L.=carrots, cv. Nantaise, Peptide Partial, 10 aa] [Daucus carota]
GWASVQSIPR